jgi:hypothetical protein
MSGGRRRMKKCNDAEIHGNLLMSYEKHRVWRMEFGLLCREVKILGYTSTLESFLANSKTSSRDLIRDHI